jgi:D-sedoheptulose 7-phosphate isomerase
MSSTRLDMPLPSEAKRCEHQGTCVAFLQQLDEHQRVMEGLRSAAPVFEDIAARLSASLRSGGTIFWFGNGGSAAQAQHLAAEIVGRYERDRDGFASLALTTDTSVLTAIANDESFDDVFARQVSALGGDADVVVALTTSGNSPNVVRGAERAVAIGAYTVALTGEGGGRVGELADAVIAVPSRRTSRIQEAHLYIGHLLCWRVEQDLPTKPQ